MLRTDISRFFPTIYTHSVPWALHGKAVAKRNQSPAGKYFGNLLDLSLRQGQDQQTMGLPIGPDTSHIIAEAIATSIDLELSEKLKGVPAGFRYVDDYYLFFATLNEAESALAALMRSLKEFELHVNFEKTKLCRVLEISDDYWTHQLRSFEIAARGPKQLSDIHHFFEFAKHLASHNADESVMTYALKRASSTLVRKENWDRFEAHVCHVALAYPVTLQTVAKVLATYAHVGYPAQKHRLARMVNAIVQDHAPLEHHSEVAWCLWMCRDLELRLTEANVDLVSVMHSSVCALLLLDLESRGMLPKPVKTSYWKQFQSMEALHGDMWLLSYEAGMRGWAGYTDAHIKADKHFDLLRSRDIHFYNLAAELGPMFHAKPNVLKQRNLLDLADIFDLDDADELIEFDESDGGYEGVAAPADADEFEDLDLNGEEDAADAGEGENEGEGDDDKAYY